MKTLLFTLSLLMLQVGLGRAENIPAPIQVATSSPSADDLPEDFISFGAAQTSVTIPWIAYGHLVSASTGLYLYTAMYATGIQYKPLDLTGMQTNTVTGAAMCSFKVGPILICPSVQGGTASTATNTGYSVDTGGFGVVRFGKLPLALTVGGNFQKSSLNGTDKLLLIGLNVHISHR